MTLFDLMATISEDSAVKLFENGEEIAEYNGGDSLPADLGERRVLSVYAGHFFIGIET